MLNGLRKAIIAADKSLTVYCTEVIECVYKRCALGPLKASALSGFKLSLYGKSNRAVYWNNETESH